MPELSMHKHKLFPHWFLYVTYCLSHKYLSQYVPHCRRYKSMISLAMWCSTHQLAYPQVASMYVLMGSLSLASQWWKFFDSLLAITWTTQTHRLTWFAWN